jgi:hypothetical protein
MKKIKVNFDDLFKIKGRHKLPPSLDEGGAPDNDERSTWAEDTLAHFADFTGLKPEGDGWPCVIHDLICDIAHFCDRNKISLPKCIGHARRMYEDETCAEGKQFEDVCTEELRTVFGLKKFTVILMYPDYAADTFGDTWCATVDGNNPTEAIEEAKKKCMADNPGPQMKPEDIGVVAVFLGNHQDLSPI